MANEQTRKLRVIAALLALAMLLELMPLAALQAWAAEDDASGAITYLDADGKEQTVEAGEYTTVTSTDTTWNAATSKFYLVSGSDVTISGSVKVTGKVTLILADDCNLTVTEGITVDYGYGTTNSLTICAQSTGDQMGTLTIGTENEPCTNTAIGSSSDSSGSITINGGRINVYGGEKPAMGSIKPGSSCGEITINGGVVTATSNTDAIYSKNITIAGDANVTASSASGAAIKSGHVNINGSTVTAKGASSGILGSEITIDDGIVTAVGGANGYGIGATESSNGFIKINGGTVYADGGYSITAENALTCGSGGGIYARNITIGTDGGDTSSPQVTATGGNGSAIYFNFNSDLSSSCIDILSGTVKATTMATDSTNPAISGGKETKIQIEGGDVTVISNGKGAGISAKSRASVQISGGTVNVSSAGGAGIAATSKVTISNGIVNATGGAGSAGIGGGNGAITISGGTVTATGADGGAGIGGGSSTITVSGGTVTATGSDSSAGIGGTFTTGTSGNAVIFASSISDNDDMSAWSGVIFQGDEGTIYPADGNFTLTQDLTIPEGKTLTIQEGQKLAIQNATLTIEQGATLEVYASSLESGNITTDENSKIVRKAGSNFVVLADSTGATVDADEDHLNGLTIVTETEPSTDSGDDQKTDTTQSTSPQPEPKQDDNAKSDADDGGAVLLAVGAVAVGAVVGGVLWLRDKGLLPDWFNKAAKLGGVAMDEAGNVLQNATILVQQLQEGQAVTVQTTTADAGGNYTIKVPDGDYTITAQYTDPLTGEARTVELNVGQNAAA